MIKLTNCSCVAKQQAINETQIISFVDDDTPFSHDIVSKCVVEN